MSIQLGSDVPYCIGGNTALVLGRGEQVIVQDKLPQCWFVLCKPEESYSTAAMYRRIDDEQPQCAVDTEGMLQALKEQDLHRVAALVSNVFEAVLPVGSAVVPIRQMLRRLGADAACMSGSGSAVFGLFAAEEAAIAACAALKEEYPHTWLAKSV